MTELAAARLATVEDTRAVEDLRAVGDLRAVQDLALAVGRMAAWEAALPSGRLRVSGDLASVLGCAPEEPGLERRLGELVEPVLTAVRGLSLWELYDTQVQLDGDRWLRVVARPVHLDGRPVAVLGVVADVSESRRSEQALADLVDRYRLLVDLSPDGVIVHRDGRVVYANAAAVRLAGLSDPGDAIDRPITGWIAPEHRGALLSRIATLSSPGAVSLPAEVDLLRADGGRAPVESISVRTTWEGQPAFQVILRDLSDRRAAEAERRIAEERFTAVVASLEEGVLVIDPDGIITSANAAACQLMGFTAAQLVGRPLRAVDAIVGEDGHALGDEERPALRVARSGEPISQKVFGIRHPDGVRQWISVNARPLPRPNGQGNHPVVVSFVDITDRREAAARLHRQARHDPLTGLPNRGVVLEWLSQGLYRQQEGRGTVAVLFLDLDRFKVVNDSLGHEVGDRVLMTVARRLRGAVRGEDRVGRHGGDEFVVVCHGQQDEADVQRLAIRLGEVVAEPISIDGREVRISVSIGIALAGDPRLQEATDLLRDADVAMYRAKERGGSRYDLFDAELRERALTRLELEEDLRAALRRDELWVAYQPVLSLATGRIIGTEALVRWQHPRRGPVSPAEFIPLAEETGLVMPVGARVLEKACRQTAVWRTTHPSLGRLTVSVNLSARQLAEPLIVDTVRDTLARTSLPAEALWLEITESTLMADADAAVQTLAELRALGVHLSIDDFGTGYSSLAYLRRFPVEALKVDRSFVDGMTKDVGDGAIVASVISLAHTLGLSVVAEGVETVEQESLLRDLGAEASQGYLHGRPQAPAELLPLLLR